MDLVTSTYPAPRPSESLSVPAIPRLIATDLDGTLLRTDQTVSARTIAALTAAEAAGIEIFFVTGRPARWMGVVADHARPTPAAGEPATAGPSLCGHGIAICANGAAVYDLHRDRLISTYPLPTDSALTVVEALRDAMPGTCFAVERSGSFGYEPQYAAVWADPHSVSAPIDELLADGDGQPILKLLAKHASADPDAYLRTARSAAGDHAEFTRSSPSALLEISGSGVSKASTLARCCAERGIAAEEVVAFGDMPNDLAMLSWVGTSYAVANAHPEVLAATTHHTAANDEDGVAQAVERILAALPG